MAKRLATTLQAVRSSQLSKPHPQDHSSMSLPYTLAFPVRRSAKHQPSISCKNAKQNQPSAHCPISALCPGKMEGDAGNCSSDVLDCSHDASCRTQLEAATAAAGTALHGHRPAGISNALDHSRQANGFGGGAMPGFEVCLESLPGKHSDQSKSSSLHAGGSTDTQLGNAVHFKAPACSEAAARAVACETEILDGQAVAGSQPDIASDIPSSYVMENFPGHGPMQESPNMRQSHSCQLGTKAVSAGMACESPMVQPSPAPLRQRLNLDGIAFQPCRRISAAPTLAEDGPVCSTMQSLDDVDVIEID